MEVKEKIKKTIQKHTENGHSVNGSTVINKRIPVLKTYKLYINVSFRDQKADAITNLQIVTEK